ncbi:chemotaxis protein CheR [Salipaludibacillus keqinensis]|uniref:protein-glutamate O-methyltransferase n=1 Tax=Salipaludibacillus keqinensis TaxID=2045207 RepID=A0A323THX9_9BACI|nr:protein-glutamate O-methyltransferase CheR [Salipaludibacillus keqinensis]PYZ94511.1 chemotaxis protein CheR [Salipaludibacillus keqinensis]
MEDYQQFIDKVKRKTGIDLFLYKEAQMKRRLTSLREKRGFSNFDDYFKALTNDQTLFEEFLQRMTINVSEFYRNPQRWSVLEEKILPRLLANQTKIKTWSAACSTGEEPYSLMMMLLKYLSPRQIDLLATDLDQSILDRAMKGFYPERSLKEVNSNMLKQYFINEQVGYRAKEELKKTITFRRHNLLAEPFDKGFDLIICRNVMIYFTEQAKDELYQKFSNALKPGGVLFVGSTEQIFNPQRYGFETEDTFFYKKINESR